MSETATVSTTIREATIADVDRIVKLGLRFAETEYRDILPVTASGLAAFVRLLLESQTSVVFVAEHDGELDGGIAMTTYIHQMSGEVIATEIAWWVEPESRNGRSALLLLRTAERWAKERQATKFQMIAPTDRLAAFYERVGFRRIEIHYQKDL